MTRPSRQMATRGEGTAGSGDGYNRAVEILADLPRLALCAAPLAAMHVITPPGAVLLLGGWGCFVAAMHRGFRPTRVSALFAWPLLTSLACLVAGEAWPAGVDGDGPFANDRGVVVLDVLATSHLVGALAVVARARGQRLMAAAMMAWGTLYFLGCVFFALIKVTGEGP